MTEIAAQIQPDAGGLLVVRPVASGEAFLKDAADVLWIDADPVIGDEQLDAVFPASGVDADHTALRRCVGQCVGHDLIQDELDPLLIGIDDLFQPFQLDADLFVDEVVGMLLDDIVDDEGQFDLLDDVIIFHIGAACIEQRLFHKALYVLDLFADGVADITGIVVGDELGRRQRCLDLVDPHFDVIAVLVFRQTILLDVFLHGASAFPQDGIQQLSVDEVRFPDDVRDQILLIQRLHRIQQVLVVLPAAGVFHHQKADRQDPVKHQQQDDDRGRDLQGVEKEREQQADKQRGEDDVELIREEFTDLHR